MIYVGLGSNLGDREKYLIGSLKLINQEIAAITQYSSIYESPALLHDDSPDEWQQSFLNMVIKIDYYHLSPFKMLSQLQMIEKQAGKIKRGIWAPRETDLDLLKFGDVEINSDELTIPHPEILNRAFVLAPLAEIAGDIRWNYNGKHQGKTIKEIWLEKQKQITPQVKIWKSNKEFN